MPLADDLENGYIREQEGILYAVGIIGTECWFEFSGDRGATKSAFADASTKKKVSDCDAGSRPAIEVYGSGEFEVVLVYTSAAEVWSSRDGGETWAQVTGL